VPKRKFGVNQALSPFFSPKSPPKPSAHVEKFDKTKNLTLAGHCSLATKVCCKQSRKCQRPVFLKKNNRQTNNPSIINIYRFCFAYRVNVAKRGNYLQDYEIQVIENKRTYLDKDTRLMIKASRGNQKAYTVLYNKYFSIVTQFVSSRNGQVPSAEDITQEVFARVWENRAKYRPKSAFKTYLFGYAKIILREYEASACQVMPLNSEDFVNLIANSPPPDAFSEMEDIATMLRKLIDRLSHVQKLIVESIYFNGSSAGEIAQILQCSVHCVYANLTHAKKNLRKLATVHNLIKKNSL